MAVLSSILLSVSEPQSLSVLDPGRRAIPRIEIGAFNAPSR